MTSRRLFTLLGIDWTVTAQSPQFIVSRLVVGTIISFLFAPVEGIVQHLLWGVIYGLLLMFTQFMHIIGHTIGGKIAGAPMSENQIRRDFIATLYRHDPPNLPRRAHLTRTLAGPAMNITIGLLALLLWTQIGGHALRYFAVVNLILSLIVLLPIPTLDGEILWKRATA